MEDMKRLRGLIPLSIGLACVACASGDVSGHWEGTVVDSAGVELIANPSTGIWQPGEEWQLVEDLVIGAAEGAPQLQFGHIAGVCVGSDHRIYVVDELAGSVRAFGPDGSLLHTFGRRGAGPGELGADLGHCLLGPGDTLTVPDLQNFRATRFAADGAFVSAIPFSFGTAIPLAWKATTGGRIAVQLRFGMLDPREPLGAPDAIVWLRNDGSVADTALRVPQGTAIAPSAEPVAGRASYTLLAAQPVWAPSADGGIVVGSADGYRLTFHDGAGTPVRIVTKRFEPVAVTNDDRAILTDAVEQVFGAALIDNVMGGLRFAEYFPVYHQLQVGPGRSVWVQRVLQPAALSAAERASRYLGPEDPEMFLAHPCLALGDETWDVFDAAGRYLGAVTMPDRFEPLLFAGDAVYGVWRDPLDVEYVKRLRIIME